MIYTVTNIHVRLKNKLKRTKILENVEQNVELLLVARLFNHFEEIYKFREVVLVEMDWGGRRLRARTEPE